MLPEDRKHLDVTPIPEPGTQFQKDGIIWKLTGMNVEQGSFSLPRLTLEFSGVGYANPVNPVNPV